MKHIKLLITFCLLLSSAQFSNAQVLFVRPDTVLCGPSTVRFIPSFYPARATTGYDVSSIPYLPPAPYNAGTSIAINTDDRYTDSIPIGFKFCYFGRSHEHCIISSNGYISFQTALAGTYSPWSIAAAIPNPTNPVDAIMAPWQDIDPSVGGQVFYNYVGTAPFRKFIVSYYRVPMFSGTCNSFLFTGMIVLNETSNIIETFIEQKDQCPSWNNGSAIHGLHDPTGTVAVTVPGRNFPGTWSCLLDAWRFSPNGVADYTFDWTAGGRVLSTDSIYILRLDTSTSLTGRLHYGCTDQTFLDTARVAVGEFLFPLQDDTICLGDTTTYTVLGVPTTHWSPNIGLSDTVGTFIRAFPPRTQRYIVTYDCITDTVTVYVAPRFPVNAQPDTSICVGETAPLRVSPTGPGYRYQWWPNIGVDNPTSATPITTTTYINGSSSMYALAVGVTSPLGCTIYDTVHVGIRGRSPDLRITPSDSSACPGQAITLFTDARPFACGLNTTPPAAFTCDPAHIYMGRVGTGSITTGPSPFPNTTDYRIQMLIRPAEMRAAGFAAGTITDLWFDLFSPGGMDVENLNIKMGCTDADEFKPPYAFISGLNTVATLAAYTPGTTPPPLSSYFNWDGFSSIIIELCFDQPAPRIGDLPNSTATSFTSVIYEEGATASTVGCLLSNPAPSVQRPNMNFILCRADTAVYTYRWTPPTNLSCDTCKNPVATVYNDATYSVRVYDGNCYATQNVTVRIDSASVLSSTPDTTICANSPLQLYVNQAHPAPQLCTPDYTVSSIPYQRIPVSGANSVILGDDVLSSSFPLGFNFKFFCNDYNSIKICSNGWISFNPTETSSSLAPQLVPDVNVPNNLLAMAWSDLNPNAIPLRYQTIGVAPNRRFVVTYDSVPLFGSTTEFVWAQALLYETTNVIEVYFRNVQGSRNRTCGIEDQSGTLGFTPVGYNNSNWTASNEGWRFSPVYTGGDSISRVVWTPGATLSDSNSRFPVATPARNTTYIVRADYTDGCVAWDTVKVNVAPALPVNLPDSARICLGDSLMLDAGSGGTTYNWTPGRETTRSIFAETPGLYVVRVSNICTVLDSTWLVVAPAPAFDTNYTDFAACCGPLVLNMGGDPAHSYRWSNGDTTFSSSVSTTNTYTVTATNSAGCSSTYTYNLQFNCPQANASASPDTIFRDNSTTLNVSTGAGSFNYAWDPSSLVLNPNSASTNTEALTRSQTFYVRVVSPVLASNGDTCQSVDSVTVVVIDRAFFIFPDAFTPNGDGLNDYFYPVMTMGITLEEFRIFNRWGDMVYSNVNTPGWDGNFLGREQPTGTYVYSVKMKYPDPANPALMKESSAQGVVTLIR